MRSECCSLERNQVYCSFCISRMSGVLDIITEIEAKLSLHPVFTRVAIAKGGPRSLESSFVQTYWLAW